MAGCNPRLQLLKLISTARCEVQVGIFCRKGFGKMCANAHRGTSDQDVLAAKLKIHLKFLILAFPTR
jgi:hypothetical protein